MHFKNLVLLCLFLLVTPSLAYAEETIGEKDVSMENHFLFMKDSVVLLKKGDQRVDIAFAVTNDEQNILTATLSQRTFSLMVSYFLGVGHGVEIFTSIPVSHAKTKAYDFFLESNKEKIISSLNNATLGIKKSLLIQNANRPEVIGSLSVSLPMSNKSGNYPTDTAMATELTAIKSVDPVVLYGGVSYTYPFGDDDDIFGVRIGTAFAVNHKIAYGGELSASKISGNDTTLSPVSIFTLRGIYSVSKKFSIESSLSFGLSDSAPDSNFQLSFSWSY